MNLICKLLGHVEPIKNRPDKDLAEFLGGRCYQAYCMRCGKLINFPNVNHPGWIEI